MAKGMKHGAGGPSILDFRVVGGTAVPTNPKENTIWVNTDTPITGYVFVAAEPNDPTEGMVWFSTGRSSAVEFNALKKNGIQVYPVSAKQYVSGAWVDVTARSHQGGTWADWNVYLYKNGVVCEDLTGTWFTEARTNKPAGGITCHPNVVKNPDSISIRGLGGGQGGIYRATKQIDLTDANRLVLFGSAYNQYSDCDWANLYIWSAMGTYYTDNVVGTYRFTGTSTDVEISIDVSNLNGSYYIGFGVYGPCWVTMKELYLM